DQCPSTTPAPRPPGAGAPPIGASLRRSFLIGLTSRDVDCRDTTHPGYPLPGLGNPCVTSPHGVLRKGLWRPAACVLRAAVAGEALAAAHLEAAPRALERAVAPFHRRSAARAG